MFKRKIDVDKHVSSVLAKKNDEKGKNMLGFQIAKLYVDIQEYEMAKKYLSRYLSVCEAVPRAHQLMGEINQALGLKELSVNNYKRSLDLCSFGSSNKDLVKKICELYCELGTDAERLKYWLDKCEPLFPKSDIVFKLKAGMAAANNDGNFDQSNDMEKLVVTELSNQPTNVSLHKQLLDIYMGSGRYFEAYSAAVSADVTMNFADQLLWFESLDHVFLEYLEQTPDAKTNPIYNKHLLHILRNLTLLSLERKEIEECTQALARFDRQLQFTLSLPSQDETFAAILKEMKGQILFLAGLLLLKSGQAGILAWPDAIYFAKTYFWASFSVNPLDSQALWYVNAPSELRKFYHWWYLQSFDRLSQVGHMLLQFSKCNLSERIAQQTMTPVSSPKLFQILCSPTCLTEQDQSFLNQVGQIGADTSQREPLTQGTMIEFDRVAVRAHGGNLSHIVWLCLQHYSLEMDAQPNYNFQLFDSLPYSVTDMENPCVSTLCQLDLQVFLLATVRCSAHANKQNGNLSGPPKMLPTCLSQSSLCNEKQTLFWEAAHNFCTTTVQADKKKMCTILRHGIEVVRLIGSHGVSISMQAHIARTLDAQVMSCRKLKPGLLDRDADLISLESRASFFWEKTQQAIEELSRKKKLYLPNNRWFEEPGDQDLPLDFIQKLKAESTAALSQKLKSETTSAKSESPMSNNQQSTTTGDSKSNMSLKSHQVKISQEEKDKLFSPNACVGGKTNGGSTEACTALKHNPSHSPDGNQKSQFCSADGSQESKTLVDKKSSLVKALLDMNEQLVSQNGKLIEENSLLKSTIKEKESLIEELQCQINSMCTSYCPVPSWTSTVPVPSQTSTVPVPSQTSTVPVPSQTSTVPVPSQTSTVPVTSQTSTVPVPSQTSTVPVPSQTSTVCLSWTPGLEEYDPKVPSSANRVPLSIQSFSPEDITGSFKSYSGQCRTRVGLEKIGFPECQRRRVFKSKKQFPKYSTLHSSQDDAIGISEGPVKKSYHSASTWNLQMTPKSNTSPNGIMSCSPMSPETELGVRETVPSPDSSLKLISLSSLIRNKNMTDADRTTYNLPSVVDGSQEVHKSF